MSCPFTPASVLTQFAELYDTDPDRTLFTFVDQDGADARMLTVRQLAAGAQAVAEGLRAWGVPPGERAVLVYPPSLDFIEAYLGCLAAGVLPVPVYPPDPRGLRRSLASFGRITEDCGAAIVLTNGEYDRIRRAASVGSLFGRGGAWPDVRWRRTDRLAAALTGTDPAGWHRPAGADEPAFIQYTSGSTGEPKGVVVTHGNLAHEIAANVVDLRLGPGTEGVFWLPQYHDMGLINVILSTAVGNSHTRLISPLAFLRRPSVWIEVMSRARATITSAPNFGYELAVRKTTPEQRARWDLSALELAVVAAEPVRMTTVAAFVDAFRGCGLRPEAMIAAYGMAENTASVTNGGRGSVLLDKARLEAGEVARVEPGFPGDTVSSANCGRSSKPGDVIRVVDPDTRRACPPGRTGEIWVRSATTAAGYHGRPGLSREVFGATIDGEEGDGGEDSPTYLRTGDIGFLLDGDLYVSGRRKDLIVVRGRNIHPADVEDSVRGSHRLIRPGGVAVFGFEPEGGPEAAGLDGEWLGVFAETVRERPDEALIGEIAQAVRHAVHRDHRLAVRLLVLGRPGLVRKTTSGKVRRAACRQAHLDGGVAGSRKTIRVLRYVPGLDAPDAPDAPDTPADELSEAAR